VTPSAIDQALGDEPPAARQFDLQGRPWQEGRKGISVEKGRKRLNR